MLTGHLSKSGKWVPKNTTRCSLLLLLQSVTTEELSSRNWCIHFPSAVPDFRESNKKEERKKREIISAVGPLIHDCFRNEVFAVQKTDRYLQSQLISTLCNIWETFGTKTAESTVLTHACERWGDQPCVNTAMSQYEWLGLFVLEKEVVWTDKRKMPRILGTLCYKLTAIWALTKNCQLFSQTCAYPVIVVLV